MNTSSYSSASESESIEARAAAWLAESDDGLTVEQAKAFAAWRTEDSRHDAAVVRLQSAWQALGQLRAFSPAAKSDTNLVRFALPTGPKAGRGAWQPVWTVAATVALAAMTFLYWERFATAGVEPRMPQVQVVLPHYETTLGGYQRATLPDGSVVELNASSKIELAFAADERRVKLRRGEVHFTVMKDKARPFVVEANGLDVRAAGTAFNVKMDPQAVEVLVTEGSVRLQETAANHGPIDNSPIMVAGHWTSVANRADLSRPEIKRLPAESIRELLSWQDNRLVFMETPLAVAVERFNVRNQVQIRIDDPDLAAVLIEGSIQADNIEAFILLISRGGDVRVTRPSLDLIVLQQAR